MSQPTQDIEGMKRRAAATALKQVRSGMVLGLGTGSTVAHLLDRLASAITARALTDIVAVPTSVQTEQRAQAAGIPLIGLGDRPRIDLTIDGADEISPALDLIKGGGGALLREKMVAQASDRVVIIADGSKCVERLGSTFALPIEVVPWGWESHAPFVLEYGGEAKLRRRADGSPTITDNGNYVLDCRFAAGIDDPESLEAALARRAGVVESGLFIGLAHEALVANGERVETLVRPA
jgi:ribose 5-phosphate isomerase A